MWVNFKTWLKGRKKWAFPWVEKCKCGICQDWCHTYKLSGEWAAVKFFTVPIIQSSYCRAGFVWVLGAWLRVSGLVPGPVGWLLCRQPHYNVRDVTSRRSTWRAQGCGRILCTWNEPEGFRGVLSYVLTGEQGFSRGGKVTLEQWEQVAEFSIPGLRERFGRVRHGQGSAAGELERRNGCHWGVSALPCGCRTH